LENGVLTNRDLWKLTGRIRKLHTELPPLHQQPQNIPTIRACNVLCVSFSIEKAFQGSSASAESDN